MHVLTGSPCSHPWPGLACPLCRTDLTGGREAALSSADAVAALAGAAEVTLRDGDLLQRPEALDIVSAFRGAGARQVELWTTGVMLARPGVAEAVLRAGVTVLAAPLWGDSAESHDWIVGQPGHFLRTIAGLKRVRALGGRTVVVVPLLRPTFRTLPQLVQKSLPLDVSGFRFVTLPGPDRSAQPLLPSLELAAPYLRSAVHMAATAKRSVEVVDVTPCLLGDRASSVTWTGEPRVALGASATAREQGPPCAGCTWGALCPGLPTATTARYGWGSLAGRTDAPPASATK